MINQVFTLPPMSFIGGSTQTFAINFKTESGALFDAAGCNASFSVLHYSGRNGHPVITKDVQIQMGEDGTLCRGIVGFLPEDTMNLRGRFIYQISVKAPNGEIEIPGQGIMNIQQNIHPQFIKQ